ARSFGHGILDRCCVVSPKRASPETPEHDIHRVDDDAGVPAGGAHPLAHDAEVVFESARGDVPARDVACSRLLRDRSLARQPEGAPVALAVLVVVHLRESHPPEPPRGPWAEVSL